MILRNPNNPGGIRATLEHWYKNPENHDKWVMFNGVEVLLRDRPLDGDRWRCIGKVTDIVSIIDGGHQTLEEFLYGDI